jgi:hypothetical protein
MLLALVLLGVAFLLFERFRGQIALANYKKELIAQGEKLSPQDFINNRLTPDTDAAPIIATIGKIQPGKVIVHSLPPLMKLLASGRAIVGFREPEWVETWSFKDGEWVEGKVTNRWEQVAVDLESNALVLAEIRTAMQKPVFVNAIDYAAGPKIKIPHLAKAKSLAQWLQAEIALALHEGRRADALAALQCQIRIPKLLAEDKIWISELVRGALGAIARANTWEALQRDDWQDEELAVIQQAWADQHFADGITAALECELMAMTITYQQLRNSNQETHVPLEATDSLGTIFSSLANIDDPETEEDSIWTKIPFHEELTEFWQSQIYCRIWLFAWSHQAEYKALTEVYSALELMREGDSKKSYAHIRPKFEAIEAAGEKMGFYDRARFLLENLRGAYSRAVRRSMRAETDRALCIAAIALQRHFIRHGNYPNQLEALVPEFLSSVPVDYMDGQPIKCRLNPDGSFTLYSVGEDGKDDGGGMSLPEGSKSRDLWRRKDYVWPAPATPEEVTEYRRQAGQN